MGSMNVHRALALGLVLALQAGCGSNCDRSPDQDPVRYTGGTTDLVRGTYESAPPDGPFLDFPGGRTFRFFHGLGAVPHFYLAEFAFDEYPRSSVTAAGNQATWEAVTAEYIDVRNDACSDVKIRVIAGNAAGAPPSDAGID